MKGLYCMLCKRGWSEWGKWPKSCPYCGSKKVIPSEEAR